MTTDEANDIFGAVAAAIFAGHVPLALYVAHRDTLAEAWRRTTHGGHMWYVVDALGYELPIGFVGDDLNKMCDDIRRLHPNLSWYDVLRDAARRQR